MLILSFLILKVSSKSFFPFSLYSAKEKNSARKTSVVHAQFTKSLYRLQRKNMRKNKLSILPTLSDGKQSTTLLYFQRQVRKHLKSTCLGWRKIKRLTELIKPGNDRKFHWNTPSSYWDISVRAYYFGRSKNALSTFLSYGAIFKDSFLMSTGRYFNVITTSISRRDVV